MRLATHPLRSSCTSNLARAALPLLLTLALAPVGCWTRLTTPKESFLYQPPKIEVPEAGANAQVFSAPQYNAELEKIEAKLGP